MGRYSYEGSDKDRGVKIKLIVIPLLIDVEVDGLQSLQGVFAQPKSPQQDCMGTFSGFKTPAY